MQKYIFLLFSSFVLLGFLSNRSEAQNACSGSITLSAADCNAVTIGNGTAGSIRICLTTNGIGSGMCTPGGSCNPPYSGGGWGARLVIYGSNGTTYSGTSQATWTSTTANGTCFTLTTTNGYATIFGLCLGANTTISWSTVNTCGDQVCTGTPPPCGGPVCTTCASACPTCGFSTAPTVAQVTSSCPDYPFNPPLATGQSATRCHTFTAVNTTVSFNVIISSNCSGGNVSAFSWTLQQSSCGGVIQSGTLSSLSFSGLTIGAQYTFCYTFTVPNPGPPTNNCTHTTHYPYFVGAAPMPVELITFEGKAVNKSVLLNWTTASETNNDFFLIERSINGKTFEAVSKVKGAGNSSQILKYSETDNNPPSGNVYYRLFQVDFDGTSSYSETIAINVNGRKGTLKVIPNPVNESSVLQIDSDQNKTVQINIFNSSGWKVESMVTGVTEGSNTIPLNSANLEKGLYFIEVGSAKETQRLKFIK